MRRFLVTILLLPILQSVLMAQNYTDSYETIRHSAPEKHDSIYYEYFKKNRTTDISKAKHYASLAYENAKRFNHPLLKVKACNGLAYAFNQENKPDSSAYFYREGIKISRENSFSDRLIYLYNDLGALYESLDFYDSALFYFSMSYDLAEETKSIYDQAIAKNNIGLVYKHIDNFNDALKNLNEALEIKKKNGISEGQTINMINIALIYNDQGFYDKAIKELKEVEKVCSTCDGHTLADLYYGLGYSYLKKNDTKLAYQHFVKSLDFARKNNSKPALANTLYQLSIFETKKGAYHAAIENLEEAIKIATEIKLKRLQRDIYKDFADIYRQTGQLDKVVIYQNRYIQIKDSLFNSRVANNLKEIQLEVQRKETTAMLNEKDTKLKQSYVVSILVGISLVMAIIISILIFRTLEMNKRNKKKLEEEVKKRTHDLEKSNSLLERSYKQYDTLVNASSEELRGPIATVLGLANLAVKDKGDVNKLNNYLDLIKTSAEDLNHVLSRLTEINNIRNQPILMEDVNLKKIIDDSYNSFHGLNQFRMISFVCEVPDKLTIQTDQRLLSFITKQLTENALKYFSPHNETRFIRFYSTVSNGHINLFVEDNGIGIDPSLRDNLFTLFPFSTEEIRSGMGLFLSQVAAQRLNGKLSLMNSSNPTRFQLTLTTDSFIVS